MKKPQLISIIIILCSISQLSLAIDWTSSNIQLLYGSDFEFGNGDKYPIIINLTFYLGT